MRANTSTYVLLLLLLGCLLVVESSPDVAPLLSFLSCITSDPSGSLSDWGSRPDPCNWTGITCGANRRVSHVLLPGMSLSGSIPSSLSNLSFLSVLDLSRNSLFGPLPRSLGQLVRLRQVSLASNRLTGSIPEELGSLGRLAYLDLGGNRLGGLVPRPLLCNLTSLVYIDLSNNSLDGPIPMGPSCSLPSLRFMLMWSNHLSGRVPDTLGNSTALEWLDLSSNRLSGELPADVIRRFPRLQYLYLSHNHLRSGARNADLAPFFEALSGCKRLQELMLAGNALGGMLPSSVGNLSTELIELDLEDNQLHGTIPPEIANLSNLTRLDLSNNRLNGSIPIELARLGRLEQVRLARNMLSGSILYGIGNYPHLGLLDLSGNMLSGCMPDFLSGISRLRILLLNHNKLSGEIPRGLAKLEILDLSSNLLTGGIASAIAGLADLKIYLNLSHNHLTGPLPQELSQMTMVQALDLSDNMLTGSILPQIARCVALEYLNLSGNALTGPLPSTIAAMPFLAVLDVSRNMLGGPLPSTLRESTALKVVNLSLNRFTGPVPDCGVFASVPPDSLLGNPGLCGPRIAVRCDRKPRAHRTLILLLIILPSLPSITCIAMCYFHLLSSNSAQIPQSVHRKDTEFPRISHRQLADATGGFDEANLVGRGRFGQVYKGTLRDGTKIAVKVLDRGSDRGSFARECEVLRRTRHRNLMKIITTCTRPDFKALVLPLMENGSLESCLHGGTSLDFWVVVGIVGDVAQGLAYLHHHSNPRVVHCDLKPSNVLVDADMTAIVADFGISRLVHGEEPPRCDSTTGLLCGSVGYVAPEYGVGGRASTEGDVYSFGVLLLEIITGKRPTDVLFQEGSTLQDWVRAHFPHELRAVIHKPYLTGAWGDAAMRLVALGLACAQPSPSSRPTMLAVENEIGRLKEEVARRRRLVDLQLDAYVHGAA